MTPPVRISLALLAALAACGPQPAPETKQIAAKRNYNASIAGKTLSCSVDGPAYGLAFSADGRVSGRLMDADASGTWYARNPGEVEVFVDAGVLSIRDVLRGSGSTWSGRNIRCR